MQKKGEQGAPLNDAIIIAVAQLIDDAQTERRDPSHFDLESLIRRHGLITGDPNSQGQTVGKAKRVRATLSWALENEPSSGEAFVLSLINLIRGHGGFREPSPNYVGKHAIENCVAAFSSEGHDFTMDGQLRPKVLDSLSGVALTEALQVYVR